MLVVLVKSVVFRDLSNQVVSLPKGLELFLDPKTNVAYFDNMHFDLGSDEFCTLN